MGVNVNFQDRSDGDIQAFLKQLLGQQYARNSPMLQCTQKMGYQQYPMTGQATTEVITTTSIANI